MIGVMDGNVECNAIVANCPLRAGADEARSFVMMQELAASWEGQL